MPRLSPPWLLASCAIATMAGCGLELAPPSLVDDAIALVFNEPDAVPSQVPVQSSPFYAREPIFTEIPGKVGSHAATLTALPDGELLAAWYSYDGPHELTGSAIYMSRRGPQEIAWRRPWVHMDRSEGDGNPVLYSEGSTVWFFQAVTWGLWSTARIEMQLSYDGGSEWSAPVALPGPMGANVRFPPVRTASGDLLLPAYDDLLQRSLFYWSPDGLQWNLLGTLNPRPAGIQPSLAVLDEDRLVCVMRNTDKGWLWVTASVDAGRAWAPPRDSGFPNPDSPAALARLFSGNLLMVFNDSATERTRLTAALSADGGVSWPHRRLLAGGNESCSYPTLLQSADGLVHVVFSVGRERIDHVVCNEDWLAWPQEGQE